MKKQVAVKETTSHQSNGPFKVLVDDNFNYMDSSERYEAGEYETLQKAIARCKNIVDHYLITALESDSYKLSTYKPGTESDSLYAYYTMNGEDPWIRGAEPKVGTYFSAWEYAKRRCKEICGE